MGFSKFLRVMRTIVLGVFVALAFVYISFPVAFVEVSEVATNLKVAEVGAGTLRALCRDYLIPYILLAWAALAGLSVVTALVLKVARREKKVKVKKVKAPKAKKERAVRVKKEKKVAEVKAEKVVAAEPAKVDASKEDFLAKLKSMKK